MDLNGVNRVRIDGKRLMKDEGNFIVALDNFIMRAYISIERIDLEKANLSLDRKYVKDFASLTMVKILKLLYICLYVHPEFVEQLKEMSGAKSQRSRSSGSAREQREKLNHKSLLNQIATDLYMEESFNLGINSNTK